MRPRRCFSFLPSRYRGKTYRAVAKIVRTSDQVADFCRRVCAKLECCPNLFSPVLVSENCPENCSIHTKTKYSKYKLRKQHGCLGLNRGVRELVFFVCLFFNNTLRRAFPRELPQKN